MLGLGESLSPRVKSGAVLELDPSYQGPAKVGDLLVYQRGPVKICHRVLALRRNAGEWWYLLKGDRNRMVDGWIPERWIVGRVDSSKRGTVVSRLRWWWFHKFYLSPLVQILILNFKPIRINA